MRGSAGSIGGGAMLAAALLGVTAMALAIAAPARAANCPQLADFSYNGTCGPEFESPAWGDGAGWTDPSKYATIQLADITGDGTDELIGRNDAGLEVWRFDPAVGQWRPAIGADGRPQVINDFRSPLPTEDVRGSWRDPATSSTIQTPDLDGDGGHEVLANGPAGMSVWRYTPPGGSNSIDGGTWAKVSTDRVLPSPPAPSQYLSLRVANQGFAPPVVLTDQASYWTWDGNGFQATGRSTLAPNSTSPQYYLNNLSGPMPQIDTPIVPSPVDANVYRTPDGVAVQWYFNGRW
jgi:hypothetical protein